MVIIQPILLLKFSPMSFWHYDLRAAGGLRIDQNRHALDFS